MGLGRAVLGFRLEHRELYLLQADESGADLGLVVASPPRSLPVVHPHDRASLRRRLRAHLRGHDSLFTSEHRVDPDGDGNWIWMRVHGRTVQRDDRGRPRRLAGTARDTTANRHADAERRIASEVLRSMSEAVAVLDRELHFVAVNPAFTQITGYSDVEALGRPFTMLDSDGDGRGGALLADMNRQHWQGNVWMTRRDGEEILCHVKHNGIPDAGGDVNFHVVVLSDITEQKRAEQELRYLTNYDALTSLPNRSLLSERLARAIVRARREGGHVAVLFQTWTGSRTSTIRSAMPPATGSCAPPPNACSTRWARSTPSPALGGDEFTVVLEGLSASGDAEEVARQVIESFALPLVLDEHHEITVSPSIGISLFPDHAQVPTELLKHADTAMYKAKAAGRHHLAAVLGEHG